MLIEFRTENHRSVREEQAITFEAGRIGAADDPTPRSIGDLRLLPAAALYGANASGKSNLLEAVNFMREAVLESHRVWEPDQGVPRDPFAWGEGPDQPSLFEVTLLLEGVRHQYGFVADHERFLEEWLFAWPKGRKQIWYEREGDDFKFGEHLRGSHGKNELVREVTRPNALFLSAAAQHKNEQLEPISRWFSRMQTYNLPTPDRDRSFRRSTRRALRYLRWSQDLLLPGPVDAALVALLREADVGISDLKVVHRDGRRLPSHQQILVRHQSSQPEAWLPLEEESQGTIALFDIGPRLLDALATGSLMIVDELEASLHPLIALHIVKTLNDPRTNPRNAQLLFTTHDTNLLGTATGSPPLRRDQVWLTEKDHDGATRIYPLTDYKPRNSENLERGYLQGRYGAIPLLGSFALATAE